MIVSAGRARRPVLPPDRDAGPGPVATRWPGCRSGGYGIAQRSAGSTDRSGVLRSTDLTGATARQEYRSPEDQGVRGTPGALRRRAAWTQRRAGLLPLWS